jgi:hypothetical protein
MASFSADNRSQLQRAVLRSYRMSTNRKPVPSVPINRNKVKSRTDHGQSPEWKRERRASQQNHVQTNRRTVDFDYKDTSQDVCQR